MNLIIPLIFHINIDGYFIAMAFLLLLGFYVVTWDEYHTHVLYLTIISGPVEGTILFTASAVLSGLYGSEIWTAPLKDWIKPLESTPLGSFSVSTSVPISLVLASIITISTSIRRVSRKNNGVFLQLVPFISFLTAAAVCLILERGLLIHTLEVLLYVGFTFAHATVRPHCA